MASAFYTSPIQLNQACKNIISKYKNVPFRDKISNVIVLVYEVSEEVGFLLYCKMRSQILNVDNKGLVFLEVGALNF